MERFPAPRIEDAGLEDCALPPEAINEAFAKVAEYFNSRIVADNEEDDDDPGYLIRDGICNRDNSPAEDEQGKGTDLVVVEEPSFEEVLTNSGKKTGAKLEGKKPPIDGEGGKPT